MRIELKELGIDFISLGISGAFALGGMWILFVSFDEDDDDDSGMGSPVYEPFYAGSAA